jgi:hypothetical protein
MAVFAFRFAPRLSGLPSRSLERLSRGVTCRPPSLHFGAAVFAFRFAPSEDWCQRRELNPRPKAYESSALPLSYSGIQVQSILDRPRPDQPRNRPAAETTLSFTNYPSAVKSEPHFQLQVLPQGPVGRQAGNRVGQAFGRFLSGSTAGNIRAQRPAGPIGFPCGTQARR